MTEQVFLTAIKAMAEKIQMLEWEKSQLEQRIADLAERYEQMCKAAVMEGPAK